MVQVVSLNFRVLVSHVSLRVLSAEHPAAAVPTWAETAVASAPLRRKGPLLSARVERWESGDQELKREMVDHGTKTSLKGRTDENCSPEATFRDLFPHVMELSQHVMGSKEF